MNFQVSPSPSLRMVHPDAYETKQRRQEACVGEHIATDTTPTLQGV